mmetsp:Transcript_41953/g.139083  ORF Transcript_41953/g.139083 Transcript_41953/m.139083 type:complete len:230 (-) Transcript_41953:452-1141(-)
MDRRVQPLAALDGRRDRPRGRRDDQSERVHLLARRRGRGHRRRRGRGVPCERVQPEPLADRIALVARKEERHPSQAHVAAPESLAAPRVDLRVREHIADALHVDDDLPAARILKGEVAERVRRVADDLIRHIARVGRVFCEIARQEWLDGKVAAAGKRQHPALNKVDGLGHALRIEGHRKGLGLPLHPAVCLQQSDAVGLIGCILLGDEIRARTVPSLLRALQHLATVA